MTLQQLRYFCEIAARDWNISKAARSLNTSQPGISRQMQFLEDELGTTIFARRNNRIIGVTEAGSVALSIARRIIGEAESLKTFLSRLDEGKPRTLTVAATHTQARYVLPTVVKQFVQARPDVEVFLQQGVPSQLARLVQQGDADISISTMPPVVPEDVVMLPSLVVARIAVMPADHPLAGADTLTLEQIAQFPIITYDSAFIGRSAVLGTFDRAGLVPKVAISAVDTDVMKAYAAQGLGIAIISEVAFDPAADRNLRAIPVSNILGQDTIYIGLRRFTHVRRLVREFIGVFAPDLELYTISRAVNGELAEPDPRRLGRLRRPQ
jgi:LysR family cys regulon transcriptional activator